MVLYPQSILDEIRDRVSIVSYIGEFVPLKKAGRNHKGVCPFHSEKDASFIVSDVKDFYHCFGCGACGNIFSFVMEFEGLNFPEAVEHLAKRFGVELPKQDLPKSEGARLEQVSKKKKLLFRVNQLAAEFYQGQLNASGPGKKIYNYMKSRGISDELSTQHFLGAADDRWDALALHLKGRNVPLQLAEELGLIRKRPTGDYYDFLRNRLIFPIISHRSEVLGFGGRIVDAGGEGEMAKYLNSPDSLIYHKSHSVYGLNVAAREIRQKDQVIIVEGYMDALALHQAGVKNVVAPLGTAVTTSHIRLLGRYSKNMVLIFDGDEAGLKAAERTLPSFVESGLMPKIVVLLNGKDPDDFIRENDREAFDALVASSETLLAWMIRRRAQSAGTDISGKVAVIKEMAPYFDRLNNSVEFRFYRQLLADQLRMDESDLLKQLEFKGSGKNSQRAKSGEAVGQWMTERLLLSLLLENPEYVYRVSRIIDAMVFSDASFRTIFELLVEHSGDEKFSAGRLLDIVGDEALVESIQQLSVVSDVEEEQIQEVLEDCIKYLSKRSLTQKLKVITTEIKAAEEAKDTDRVTRLMSEKSKLLTELQV